MSSPQPNYGSQQPPPPPPQQYQQYPTQQSTYPPQPYGPQPPPRKSKMPMMIGIIVAVVAIIVVLAILFLVVLKPSAGAMTATQLIDDYETTGLNYKSFDVGDTITLKDEISEISSWDEDTHWITFDYEGSDSFYKTWGVMIEVSGDAGSCKEGDTISLTATVESFFTGEMAPTLLDWSIADTSSCST